MLKDDLATRARAFIDRTELPPKPPATRGPRTTPTDPGTTPAMAIGQNLVEFADDAPPELRAAVTDALLLAQLAFSLSGDDRDLIASRKAVAALWETG